MKRNTFKPVVIGFVMITVMLICYQIVAPCPGNLFDEGKWDPVQFIHSAWPQERIRLGCYYRTFLPFDSWDISTERYLNRGVGVSINGLAMENFDFPPAGQEIDLSDIMLCADRSRKNPLEDRVYLYIDGRKLPDSSFRRVNYFGGQLIIYLEANSGIPAALDVDWYPLLFFGDHTAKVVIETLMGATLEYEWHFTVTFW